MQGSLSDIFYFYLAASQGGRHPLPLAPFGDDALNVWQSIDVETAVAIMLDRLTSTLKHAYALQQEHNI